MDPLRHICVTSQRREPGRPPSGRADGLQVLDAATPLSLAAREIDARPSIGSVGTMSISEFELSFGPWAPWRDRRTLRTPVPYGGVYLLACFSSLRPLDPPNPESLPYEVVYVGDAKNLNNRPLTGPHGQVDSFAKLFHGTASLYVSVGKLFLIDGEPVHYATQRTRSVFFESKLAWDYARVYGHPPILQSKETPENEPWVRAGAARLMLSRQAPD